MEILFDALIDTLKLFPFLFITYLCLEYMEHKTADKVTNFIRKARKSGPLIGSLFGALPQCGFSVVAANLYAARIISIGTLVAIFLSTSDETIPILVAGAAPGKLIACIICYKILCGIVFGYMINFMWFRKRSHPDINIERLCEEEDCHCHKGIIVSALHHSINITLFIFVVSIILNILMMFFKPENIIKMIDIPLIGEAFCAVVGLIPNCSASVILTQLYQENYISFSALMSGSLSSGGVGLLVLFRVNRSLKENIFIFALLYACGFLGGVCSNLLPYDYLPYGK